MLGGAGVYVVQVMEARKPKPKFTAAPPNAPGAAVEHKVKASKKTAAAVPAVAKRIASTSVNAKIALPSIDMSSSSGPDVMASVMSGVGAGGLGSGAPGLASMPLTGLTAFGFKGGKGGGLAGTFYDLKQTKDGKPTGMIPTQYDKELAAFVEGNWNPSYFSKFYKGGNTIYATQIFMPDMSADKGPKAFGLEDSVQPRMWIVHYKGTVSPPTSCVFHFVGQGDDVLMVKFNHQSVLEANWSARSFGLKWKPEAVYDYGWPFAGSYPFRKSPAIRVEPGNSYPIEILIGENPGGRGHANLLIEVEGVQYKKDAKGNPILPIFRLMEIKLPSVEKGESFPPYAPGGPIWKSVR